MSMSYFFEQTINDITLIWGHLCILDHSAHLSNIFYQNHTERYLQSKLFLRDIYLTYYKQTIYIFKYCFTSF